MMSTAFGPVVAPRGAGFLSPHPPSLVGRLPQPVRRPMGMPRGALSYMAQGGMADIVNQDTRLMMPQRIIPDFLMEHMAGGGLFDVGGDQGPGWRPRHDRAPGTENMDWESMTDLSPFYRHSGGSRQGKSLGLMRALEQYNRDLSSNSIFDVDPHEALANAKQALFDQVGDSPSSFAMNIGRIPLSAALYSGDAGAENDTMGPLSGDPREGPDAGEIARRWMDALMPRRRLGMMPTP